MTQATQQAGRRHLTFDTLDDAVIEARRLLDGGYTRAGKWSLGRVCEHLSMTQNCSLDGFDMWNMPWPIPPLMRRFALSDKALSKPMPANMPAPKRMQPKVADEQDAIQVDLFATSCQRVQERLDADGIFQRSPLFGRLEAGRWHLLHLRHAGHHLGFLLPSST